ncbi:hypothetical protein Acr_00g0057800 [Actinidia rufa]|uniref:Transmembrane protein n=1 Tax=Actinidia rufa TaxID=165716 RepID=A0A7J0DMP7_9ERIC|nr:hypothetical protein Acr_00g0057800 [Actinidia rufa]
MLNRQGTGLDILQTAALARTHTRQPLCQKRTVTSLKTLNPLLLFHLFLRPPKEGPPLCLQTNLVSSSPDLARQVVSLSTCSKLCTICFVAGVVVGFSLKRRVRRWASMLLKRIKDD